MGAQGWEWINNWIAIGGFYLLAMKVIRWHIPVAVLAALIGIATVFNIYDPGHYAKATFHVFTGAAMLCNPHRLRPIPAEPNNPMMRPGLALISCERIPMETNPLPATISASFRRAES